MRFHRTNGAIVAPETTGCAADAKRRVASYPFAQRTAAALSIDEQLFRPARWLAIDAANAAVPGVRPGTIPQALALVGRGSVASFFGRLRPGVLVVDVDVADSAGPVMALVAWCVERSLWHLVRESGRPGHKHVFIVVGERAAELEAAVAELRAAERLSRSRLEVREAVRPLSAPHRSETSPPLPPLGRALRSLPRAVRSLPPLDTPVPDPPRHRAGQPPVAAVPVPRTPRPLPRSWERYLRLGVLPPQVGTWSDQSRSAVEATATFQLAATGANADQAWLAITTSHPDAMAKARSRGRAWWTSAVWNRAVADLQAAPPREPATGSPSHRTPRANRAITMAVRALQEAFLGSWTRYGRDRRHTLRFVLDTVCERMVRTGATDVPCPERDLALDTGIASRRVIREALHQLAGDGWLVLHESFDPGGDSPESRSHRASLPSQLPTSVSPRRQGVLPLRSPPSSFTPLPVRVRGHLGPELTHTWAALPQEDALPAADLGPATGLCSPGEQPTRSQLATLLGRLQRLAAAGLAACDELGRWVALPAESLSPDVAAAAEAAYAARAERISSERAQYELVRAGRHRWERERAAAVQRNRAAAYLGSRKWWEGLAADERNVRQAAYAARFANLSVAGQRAVKQELASRRARAGVASEEALRRAWIQSLPPGEYTDRVVQRTIEFAALPGPLQAAKAAAWAAHRAIWQISRDVGPPARPRQVQPERDRMDRLEQLELLALSEILERDPNGRLSGLEPGSGRAVARSRAG